MRRFLICPLLLIVFATVQAQDERPKPAEEDLFPWTIGNRWTYRIQGQDDRLVISVAAIEKIGETRCVRLEGRLFNRVIATEHLSIGPEGVLRHRNDGVDIEPALMICKFPPEKGTTWKAEYKVNDKKTALTYTCDEEEVLVPAGKFNAFVIKAEIPEKTGSLKSAVWYVPKIGMVKQVIADGDRTVTLILERMERAGEKDSPPKTLKKSNR